MPAFTPPLPKTLHFLDQQVVKGEIVNRTKAGKLVTLESSANPILDDEGQITGFLAIQRDVSDRKALERQLHQAQKMEAVGRLAGGIAHDFNNLLTIISGYSDLLLERLPPADPIHAQIVEIRKAASRATSLTRQLLAFSRRQILAPQVLDLNAVVTTMGQMLKRLIGEDIVLISALAPDLGRVKADPGQIEQVILNLAVNSRDAMPRGGNLTIETHNVELAQDYARKHAAVLPGHYAMLAVSDTGCGMDADTLGHVFEPFFTTKEPGKGTGLGLATVYGIVKQSGGYIWVYSDVGYGTTLKIYVPRVEAQADALVPEDSPPASATGTETIFVVEDEYAVRSLVQTTLEAKGYKVFVARHGEDALFVAEQHKGPIHLLLTDVVMPGMGGRELAERLWPFHREMKVIYMSDYTDEAVFNHGVIEIDAAFIQKPFTPEALARKVRSVLDLTPPARS